MNRIRNVLLVIIFCVIVLLLVLFSMNIKNIEIEKLEITIEDGELQPKFDMNIYEYTIYSKNSNITLTCNLNIDGCNKTIDISANKYTIKYNDKEYVFVLEKIEDDVEIPTIKILDVKGNSTNWVKEINLEVVLYNPNGEKVSFSFDNGTTWIELNKKTINKNGTYVILIKDKDNKIIDQQEVNITKIDNTSPVVSISQKKINDNEIELTATATDDLSGIESYLWSTNEKTSSIKVTKNGKYTLIVRDKVGNEVKENIEVTTIGTNEKPETTFNAIFDSNDNTGKLDNVSCSTKKDSCTITTPNITRIGYTILGWSTNPNSKTAEYKVNTPITLKSNITLYAITYKTISITFDRNGNTSQTDGNTTTTNIITKKCNIYNKETKCSIKSPKINMNGFTILGYSTGSTTYSDYWKVDTSSYVYDSKKYYAQTYKDSRVVKTYFYRNGNTSLINSAGKTITDKEYIESCTIPSVRNGSTQNDYCTIISPTIVMSGNTILGYSNSANSTNIVWNQGTKKNINIEGRYYAQSYKTFNATFDKNGSTSIGSTSLSCKSYNNNGSCTITAPTITRAKFNILGWSTNKDAVAAEYAVGTTITLTNPTTKYYAITSREITVTFDKNNNTSQSDDGRTYTTNTYNKKCTIRNAATTCSITPPTINMNNYEILGYTTGSTVYSNYWKSGSKAFSNNATYYAQTMKTVTVTFDKNTTFDNNTVPKTSSDYDWKKTNIAATKLSFYSRSCTSRNNRGCYLGKVPIIYSSGNEVVGWSYYSDGGIYYVGNRKFMQDTTFYARIYNEHTKGNFNCANCSNTNPKKIGNYIVEYENTVTASQISKYNTYLEHMYAKMPQMFKHTGIIRVVSSSSFNTWWGNYGGVTTGYNEYPIVYVLNHSENHFRGAVAHELGHALDRYYGLFSDSRTQISKIQSLIDMVGICQTDINECGFIWEGTNDSGDMKEFVAHIFHAYYYNIANDEDKWETNSPDKMVLSRKLRNKIIAFLNEISNFD